MKKWETTPSKPRLIDKVRMDAEQRVAHYKNLMTKHHDTMVKPRQFNIGHLVLRRVSLATKDLAHRKLRSNWEGPYKVINYKKMRIVLSRSLGRTKVRASMERGALKEVLSMKTPREGQHG